MLGFARTHSPSRRGGRAGGLCEFRRRAEGLLWRTWRGHLHVLECKGRVQRVLARRDKILFFPDEHLGRNTANKMGVPRQLMIVWDPYQPNGGNTRGAIQRAKLILWKGHCSVHQMFQPVHVDNFRKQYPDGKVIVHPECHEDVVNKADLTGSTEFIIKTVSGAPAGTIWAVGTELNLVNRLKRDMTDKKVFFLSSTVCQCATMFRIDATHLCWSMESLADDHVVNRIVVPDDEKQWAKIALDRMMAIS